MASQGTGLAAVASTATAERTRTAATASPVSPQVSKAIDVLKAPSLLVIARYSSLILFIAIAVLAVRASISPAFITSVLLVGIAAIISWSVSWSGSPS